MVSGLKISQQYFIDLLKHRLKNKNITTHDNFFSVAKEYIQLVNDIKSSSEYTSKLLERSLEDYKKLLIFSVKKNILYKNHTTFTKDFQSLLEISSDNSCSNEYLGITVNTFLKKFENTYFEEVDKLLKSGKRIDFIDIKCLVDEFFQELIVREIPIETVNNLIHHDPENFILKLNHNTEISGNSKYVLLKIEVPEEIKADRYFYLNEILFSKLFDHNFDLITEHNLKFFSKDNLESLTKKIAEQDIPSKYGRKSNGDIYIVDLMTINAFDDASKIMIIVKMIDNNFKYFHMLSQQNPKTYHNNSLIYDSASNELNIYTIPQNSTNLLKSQTTKFSSDKKEFLDEFIKESFNGGTDIHGYQTIFNLINLLDSSDNLTPDNQLIILWSCMEKIITNIEGKSIIQKVVNINQQANVIYSIKSKMNFLWYEIVNTRDTDLLMIFHASISNKNEFITVHNNDDDYVQFENFIDDSIHNSTYEPSKFKYDPFYFIYEMSLLTNEQQDLIMEKSKILGVNMYEFEKFILKDKTSLIHYLKNEEELIKHEFTRIYRHRNLLVHTNTDSINNINLHVQILKKNLYSLLSIIIHYSLRNKDVNITDILYSIDLTHKRFWKTVTQLEEKYNYESIQSLIKFEYSLL